MSSRQHQKLFNALYKDRRLAHAVLFKQRHNLESAAFHGEIIDVFHDLRIAQAVIEAFRGAGKSTIGEEAIVIMAAFQDFWNAVIIGSTEPRAIERLAAIKHQFEHNEALIELVGDQVGDVWQAHKIVLKCGVCIQAVGVNQHVRGLKHLDWRPGFLWPDDVEDDDSVKTPEASNERMTWLYGTLLPLCAKNPRIRVTGNRLSPHAVVTQLASSQYWTAKRYPVARQDLFTGEEVATWAELYDLEWIRQRRAEYESVGQGQKWASEYMCEAMAETVRPFKPEDMLFVERARTYHPVQVMYDPAKTGAGLRHQSQYAKAAWSWVGRKLIVWESWGKPMQPSELLDDIFKTEVNFAPIGIAVEKTGLDDWLMEPLRLEQQKRGILLPHLTGEPAPKDKISFIRMLQPYFASHDVEIVGNQGDLRAQLLNFPTGRMDIVNALAYALKLRPGQPIYDNFGEENVIEDAAVSARGRCYLCLNGDGAYVTGVLVQFDGTLTILADWIEGGETTRAVDLICKQAAVAIGAARDGAINVPARFEIYVPPKEVDQYLNKGIAAALRRLPRVFTAGADPGPGREQIRDLLSTRSARPALLVSSEASWSLRAFSGGYTRLAERSGVVLNEPEPGAYTTLMQALESFAGVMYARTDDPSRGIHGDLYSVSRGGVIYKSMIGEPLRPAASKADFVRQP